MEPCGGPDVQCGVRGEVDSEQMSATSKWKPTREARVGDIDPNPFACESSRSQLSHALRFKSKSLTVASEISTKNA